MLRVLFVNDDPAGRDAIMRITATRQHWQVAPAPDVSTALDLLEAQPFDVIVTTELRGPVDGRELLHVCELRWPELSRVMLVRKIPAPEDVACAHAFLLMPVPNPLLADVIDELVESRRPQAVFDAHVEP